MNTSFEFDVALEDGQYYYTCVAAVNFAGLVTLVSSDGFATDSTPPRILWAHDGFGGPDIDTASFIDAYFGNWRTDDGESGVSSIEFGVIRIDGEALNILRNASEAVGLDTPW